MLLTQQIAICVVMSNTKHQYLRILRSLAVSTVPHYQQCMLVLTSQLRTADLILGADLTPNPLQRFGFLATPFFSIFMPM